MYPPVVNSPKTELTELITDKQTEITVANVSVLLQGEGIAVLGNGDAAETITYTSVEDNVLKGCVRGFEGVARAWPVGTRVARNFTAADFKAAQDNIIEIDGKVTTLSTTVSEKTQNASLTKKGVTQLSEAVDGTRNDIAATESAVKKAYDLANGRETPSGAQAKADGAKLSAQAYADITFVKLAGTQNIELGLKNNSQNSPAFIDFHCSSVDNDYDARIMVDGSNGDTGGGTIQLFAKGVSFFIPSGRVDANELKDLYTGLGSPEGIRAAPVGSLYRRYDGGSSSTFYVKEAGGSGNTGWRAI
ncbi:tail fiber protein [Paenibacillus sp. EKM208P]|nr:tail fiber protein [Paenibacillus sp. EKM208P]